MPYKIRSELASFGETVVHGPGAPAHLPESPFQDIGGADGFPALWRKVIKVHAVLY
jgi:hypothetical protein